MCSGFMRTVPGPGKKHLPSKTMAFHKHTQKSCIVSVKAFIYIYFMCSVFVLRKYQGKILQNKVFR